MSITHLVINDHDDVGYFTLTHKPSIVTSDSLSKTEYKKL